MPSPSQQAHLYFLLVDGDIGQSLLTINYHWHDFNG